MSLTILLQGTLASDPQQRTSASGKPFATCSVRVPADEEAIFVSVVAFGELADALLGHAKGDSLAIAGRGSLKGWTDKSGVERHGLSVVAERILSLYDLGKRRERAAAAAGAGKKVAEGHAPCPSPALRPEEAAGGVGDMADDLPWAGQT